MSFLSKAWDVVKDVGSTVASVASNSNPYSAAINAGINLLGDVAGNVWSNANTISAAQRDYRYAKDLMDYQNEYNKPVNQMARYREAGLNPNLIYGQSNLSASGSASASAARAQAPQLRLMEYNKDKAMIENMRVTNDNLRAQTLNLQAQNGLIGAQQAEAGSRMAEALQRVKLLAGQTRGQELENVLAAHNAGYSEAEYRRFVDSGGKDIPKRFTGQTKTQKNIDETLNSVITATKDAFSFAEKAYNWFAGQKPAKVAAKQIGKAVGISFGNEDTAHYSGSGKDGKTYYWKERR